MTIRQQLLDDGFAVVPGVLTDVALANLRDACARSIAAASAEHLSANRTTGSMLGVERDPAFAELIAWPSTLEILRELGWGNVAWSAGYVINKPARAPRLFWHQDWLWWTHPVSGEAVPHQLFAMYYLTDTNRANGCLRVLPGSHRRRSDAHDRLATAHGAEALAGRDLDHPMFGDLDGEVDVPIRAGDLLLGDARLLHAAHRNMTGADRPLVTLWYHPAFDTMPAEIQNYLAENHGAALAGWPADARNLVDVRLPYKVRDADVWPICREPHSLVA